MTRPQALALKLHGIVWDLDPEDVPSNKWTGGRNIIFRNGETWRVPGAAPYADEGQLFPAKFVHWFDVGPAEYWLYGGDDGIAVYDGANHYDITPEGWAAIASKNFTYSVGDLNTLPFVNHPERGPYWWDADVTHIMEPLPDWPVNAAARVMRAHKNFLIAINVDTGAGLQEASAWYSSSADPGQVPEFWTPAPDNDAGEMTFSTPGGPLLDGISVRDQFFVAKANAMFVGQYVGGTFVFQQRDLFPSVGLFAADAWIEHGNWIYMVTGNGEIIRHDGNSLQNLAYGNCQDYFNRALNFEFPSSVFLYRDDIGGQIVIAYPTGTSEACNEGLSIEVASIGRGEMIDVSVIDLPNVWDFAIGYTDVIPQSWDEDPEPWDEDTTLWNEQASGYRPAHIVWAAGELIEKDVGNLDGLGNPVEAFVERVGLEFDTYSEHKVISGGWPRVKCNAGSTLYFRFGQQETVRAPVSWDPEIIYVQGEDDQLDFFIDGRLMAHAMRSSGGGMWKANGIVLNARTSGNW